MSLDFQEVKKIPLVEVLNRYRVPLRFSGRSATAVCPLPSHKQGEKERTFSIELDRNFFQCFSRSCNAANRGKRGGDVIDFVAIMEHCRPVEAAQKLAEWHGLMPAYRASESPLQTKEHASMKPTPTSAASGYMASVDAWFEELRIRRDGEDDSVYWKRILSAVKERLLQSFRNGKAAEQTQ
jgi:DNA primase